MPTRENRWLEYADRLDKLVDQHASQLVAAYDMRRSYNKREASHAAAENSRKKIAGILDTMRAIGESVRK